MIEFPIQSLMDEQACYDYLLAVQRTCPLARAICLSALRAYPNVSST